MRFFKIYSLLILIFVSIGPTLSTADVFEGVGSTTTDTFVSEVYTKIDWETSGWGDFSLFSGYVYELGDDLWETNFGERSGTTYLYEEGEFYFDISAANIDGWKITTTETDGEYFVEGESIKGIGSSQTKLFECFSKCEISWETSGWNEYSLLLGYVYELGGSSIWVDSFSDEGGSLFLYDEGIFYFDLGIANIDEWTITLEEVVPEETSSQTNSQTNSQTSSQTNSQTNSQTSQVDQASIINNFHYYLLIFTIFTMYKRKYEQR